MERRRRDVSSRGGNFSVQPHPLVGYFFSIFIPERWLPACWRDPVYLSRSINIGLSHGKFWPSLPPCVMQRLHISFKRMRRLTVKSAVAKIKRVPFAISFLLQNVGMNYTCLVDSAPLDSGTIFMEVNGSTTSNSLPEYQR